MIPKMRISELVSEAKNTHNRTRRHDGASPVVLTCSSLRLKNADSGTRPRIEKYPSMSLPDDLASELSRGHEAVVLHSRSVHCLAPSVPRNCCFRTTWAKNRQDPDWRRFDGKRPQGPGKDIPWHYSLMGRMAGNSAAASGHPPPIRARGNWVSERQRQLRRLGVIFLPQRQCHLNRPLHGDFGRRVKSVVRHLLVGT